MQVFLPQTARKDAAADLLKQGSSSHGGFVRRSRHVPDIKHRTVFVMYSTMMFRDAQMQMILFGIVLASALCWWLLVVTMPAEGAIVCGINGIGSSITAWSAGRIFGLLAMWGIMAPAMMLPAAAVAILQVSWEQRGDRSAYAAAMSFAGGYLLIVLASGIIAALVQWVLESIGAVISSTTMANPLLSGLLFLAAGFYQLSPLKRVPAPLCRASASGNTGDHAAINRGLRHGRSCFGCCAGMVCLQFAGGAMNIGWMAFLAAWMTAQAVLPWKRHVAVLAGTVLLVNGGLCLESML
jgi:predicted metal-binding membrane protein